MSRINPWRHMTFANLTLLGSASSLALRFVMRWVGPDPTP